MDFWRMRGNPIGTNSFLRGIDTADIVRPLRRFFPRTGNTELKSIVVVWRIRHLEMIFIPGHKILKFAMLQKKYSQNCLIFTSLGIYCICVCVCVYAPVRSRSISALLNRVRLFSIIITYSKYSRKNRERWTCKQEAFLSYLHQHCGFSSIIHCRFSYIF